MSNYQITSAQGKRKIARSNGIRIRFDRLVSRYSGLTESADNGNMK